MARTAPVVNATPTQTLVSIRYVDAQGDKRADSYVVPAGTTDAQINAFCENLATLTNANVWQIQVSRVFGVVENKASAVDEPIVSAKANIVITYRSSVGNTARLFLPAPQQALFVPGTDEPDTGNTDVDGLILAGALFFSTASETFNPVSIRYTERRESNSKKVL